MPLYTIAGFTFDLVSPSDALKRLCRGYEAELGAVADHEIVSPKDEIAAYREKHGTVSDAAAEISLTYEKICRFLLAKDALFLHAAVIEANGTAYAFSAPSGTGKSTHIALWKHTYGDSVHILNGDKPILRFENGVVYAYGTPFCGKEHWNENRKVRLGGICFLSRGETDEIREITPKEALTPLLRQILLNGGTDAVMQTMALADKLLSSVPLYALSCTPTENAARLSYQTMTKRSTR
ncbi:MAG: hypothetical protein E7657_08000 [Ruminococcaceae bacterium]|nr:hypothetical protein [Oscillospiraceae bacterium]